MILKIKWSQLALLRVFLYSFEKGLAIERVDHISFPGAILSDGIRVEEILLSHLFLCFEQFLKHFELTWCKIASLRGKRIVFERSLFSQWKIVGSLHTLVLDSQTLLKCRKFAGVLHSIIFHWWGFLISEHETLNAIEMSSHHQRSCFIISW